MKNLTLFVASTLIASAALADDWADAERLFEYAEDNFPEFFRPAGADTFEWAGYLLRHYSQTQNYLGIAQGAVSVYGPSFGSGSEILSVGQISDYIALSPVVDSGQENCFDNREVIACPGSGETFGGQDAEHAGHAPNYVDHGDGTLTDSVTDLMWQRSADSDGDGDIDAADKLSYTQAQSYCEDLSLAGYDDWRLPDIKQLYSLIDFRGIDPSGYTGSDSTGLVPFIDSGFFAFSYGDTLAGERIIDAQYASSTLYAAYVDNDAEAMLFGVNFADGRIKSYGLNLFGRDKVFYVICVRGNARYGGNDFVDHGDGTISDQASGLMWARADSGQGRDWAATLDWVARQNAASYLGYDDWRLPNAKELQGLVDYRRSADSSASAAIDPLFAVSDIVNEAGVADFPAYWTSTTHRNWSQMPGMAAVYVNFGRSMGYIDGAWVDIHGAGAQRSDPKQGDPADYPSGRGPQGDAVRIANYARLLRDLD
jgi:hypothetical protein